jgi:tRNA(Ile)-lysidine synthase
MENLKQSDLISFCRNQLSKLTVNKILLAYSGGRDSSVLLDCLHQISQDKSFSLRTMHVNHGLSSDAKKIEKHCATITDKLKISHETVMIKIGSSSNVEEQCRLKRYEVLVESCKDDEVIITGHHEEDQVETFLLRLMRGSGARGLSSMKIKSQYHKKTIFRPFLKVPKSEIKEYSVTNQIAFIEDGSNKNNLFDRNFVRNDVIPLLKSRWPSINKSIINNISVQDIQHKFIADSTNSLLPQYYGLNDKELDVAKLNLVKYHTKVMIVHEWVFLQSNVTLNLKHINEIIKILNTNNDSNPLFTYNSVTINKNRGFLILSTKS